MIKKIGIVVLADIVIIAIWISRMNLSPSVYIYIIGCLPVCFLSNLVAGLILKALKNNWSDIILLNSLISSIIFYFMFDYSMNHITDEAYKDFFFNSKLKIYNLMLYQSSGKLNDSLPFECYELQKGGSASTNFNGKYCLKNDTIILNTDSGKVVKIFKDVMYSYPGKNDTIHLRNKR